MSRPTLTEFKKKALSKPAVDKEYKALSSAYTLRKKLIALRQKAGLTQEQVADVLHTKKSNISRLENANSVNSPKLSTIEQYADAIGYDIEIKFIPKKSSHKSSRKKHVV
jgi:transcriptional regulator with XRE-family HTH domain